MQFKDYYLILGVAHAATADDIKKAYRKLARKYHPDVSKEPDAATRIIALNEANAVLSDPAKRLAYDELVRHAQAQAQSQPAGQGERPFRPPPNWDAGFEFADAASDGGEHSDFFEALFGRGARHSRAQRHRPDVNDAQMPVRGEDHHAKMELDLLDTYQGAERSITLQSAHLDETGQTVREQRHLTVKIPRGVREGQHIRLQGKGSPGFGGAPPGDLLLEVCFKADPRWHAEGRDVHQRLPLAPWEAALGGGIAVRTPGGDAEVSVPAGWRPGRKLRLKGRGIPGTTPGDLFLELDISLPPSEGDAARAAYAAMAQAFPTFNPRQQH